MAVVRAGLIAIGLMVWFSAIHLRAQGKDTLMELRIIQAVLWLILSALV